LLNHIAIIPLILMLSVCSQAELMDLTESEMSELTGEGVGLVYESYQIEMLSDVLANRADSGPNGESGNDFKITGIKDSLGNAVDVSIAQFYFAGTGTNLGADLVDRVVNIGRLNNPITVDLVDCDLLSSGTGSWSESGVLQIAMSKKYVEDAVGSGVHTDGYDCTNPTAAQGSGLCASRPADVNFHGERFDTGYRINREFTDPSKNMNLNFHAVAANMDGSYVRFWGGNTDLNGDTISDSTIMLESQMNFYASELVFNSCELDGSACGESVGFNNFKMELALGDAANYQPMTIDVTDAGLLNITIKALPKPGDSNTGGGTIGADGLIGSSDATTWNWYDNYYENGRKTNISVSDMTVGATSFGASSLQGLQIQYLEVISHEL
jgi:hypothetical protein